MVETESEERGAPPSTEIAKEMERLRLEIESGCVSGWNPYLSAEALRRVLEETGPMEEMEALKVVIEHGLFGPAGADALFGSMAPGSVRVRSLRLFGAGIADAGADALARELKSNTTITHVNVRSNGITEAGARSLAGALRENATLQRLNLVRNDIGTGGVVSVAEALGANRTLERLSFGFTECATGGVRVLTGAVTAHPSLTDLRVWRVPLDEDGAQAFAEMLRATRSLRRLQLWGDTLPGADQTIAFTAGLTHATSLRHLCLACNRQFGDAGATELATALSAGSCALTTVRLGNCSIGTAGTAALAGALRVNRSLTQLGLRGNKIGVDGAAALFEALKHNRTLAVLHLPVCKLVSTTELADALEVNRTLAVLDLSWNTGLTDEGGLALAAALARPGCALQAVDLSSCELSEQDFRVLAEALDLNSSLTTVRIKGTAHLADSVRLKIGAATARNRRLRDEAVVQREFLRSAAGSEAVPWISADVLANVVAEYVGWGWSELEQALHARTGSHLLDDEFPFGRSTWDIY